MQDRNITLTLPDLFVGQMLDGLREEQANWEYTERYHLGDGTVDFDRLLKESTGAHEARQMADFYGAIIQMVEEQVRPLLMPKVAGDISILVAEYRSLLGPHQITVNSPQAPLDWNYVVDVLTHDADWTPNAAQTLVQLARKHGSFILRNALALALALAIEDGDSGL